MTFKDDSFLLPGPPFKIDLSNLDACHPVHYSRRLLIFRCTTEEQRDGQVRALKKGLKALVLRCPILAGIMSPLPPDISKNHAEEWRTIIPGPGLELVIRDLRKKMPSFEELEKGAFQPGKLPYDKLVPVPKNVGSEGPVCKVQFSAIEGGTILAWAMSHCVADGGGNNELLGILAEEIRLAGEGGDNGIQREVVGFDRSGVRDVKSEMKFNIEEHPGYRLKPPPTSPSEQQDIHPFKATALEIPLLFSISPTALIQLKIDATPSGEAWISTHDAISALLWCTQILIRRQRSPAALSLPDSTLCSIYMPSDARRALNLPSSYIGNVTYQLSATLTLSTLLSPTGLQHAALAIRQAISAAIPEKVESLFAQTRDEWVDWAFLSSYDTTGVAMGTGWTSGGLYGLDWGNMFGKMVKYRFPDEGFNNVMPKLPDGGAEMMVLVMAEEVEVLKGIECFMKYVG
jgi:hypothetical protein